MRRNYGNTLCQASFLLKPWKFSVEGNTDNYKGQQVLRDLIGEAAVQSVVGSRSGRRSGAQSGVLLEVHSKVPPRCHWDGLELGPAGLWGGSGHSWASSLLLRAHDW